MVYRSELYSQVVNENRQTFKLCIDLEEILDHLMQYNFLTYHSPLFSFLFPPSTPLTPEAGKALRAIPLWDRVPTTWVNCLSFSIKKLKKI